MGTVDTGFFSVWTVVLIVVVVIGYFVVTNLGGRGRKR